MSVPSNRLVSAARHADAIETALDIVEPIAGDDTGATVEM
jgi:hypothetical protein